MAETMEFQTDTYSSDEDYANYPLTWELDHLTDVTSPTYNVDYVSPARKVSAKPKPPLAPRKIKKRNNARDKSKKEKKYIQKKLNFKLGKKKLD